MHEKYKIPISKKASERSWERDDGKFDEHPHLIQTIMFANRLHIFLSLALTSAIGVSAQTPKLDVCTLNCINQAVANSTCLSLFVVLLP
jgi:hypothetical protein